MATDAREALGWGGRHVGCVKARTRKSVWSQPLVNRFRLGHAIVSVVVCTRQWECQPSVLCMGHLGWAAQWHQRMT